MKKIKKLEFPYVEKKKIKLVKRDKDRKGEFGVLVLSKKIMR